MSDTDEITRLRAEIKQLRAALEEAIEFVDQAEMALTPRGEAYVARWRAAIRAMIQKEPE